MLTKYAELNKSGPCQATELGEAPASNPYPRIFTRLRLTLWYLRRDGLVPTVRRIANTLAPDMVECKKPDPAMLASLDEALNLRPGDWVEVRSKDEILATLDDHGKYRGLRFVPEMFDFCGRRFRVLKRVEKICIENTPDVRTIRNTVLLEGGICQGGGIGCDRACFHFWREIWLRKVPHLSLAESISRSTDHSSPSN
jgi:hypothetical protein